MSEPFLGEIRMIGFTFAPRGWALCNGQLLPISSYSALFSILGTTYGGDGRTTFALPDLRGRAPIHEGQGTGLSNRLLGQRLGAETHVLTEAEIPKIAHAHELRGTSDAADSDDPGRPDAVGDLRPGLPASSELEQYRGPGAMTAMRADSIAAAGGGTQAHENMQPFLTMNYAIALEGLFPSRS